MMRRRIFLWVGLGVLLVSWSLCRDGQASSTYQVRQGDTISGIAERLGVTPDALRAANHLTKDDPKPRQILTIPVSEVSQTKSQRSASLHERIYQVKKGDTLAKIADKTGISIADLREVNRLKGSVLQVGQKIERYRSQEGEGEERAESVKNQAKSEQEPEGEDADRGGAGDGAWPVVERHEQENAAPFGQWKNPEEQRMLVKVAMGFLGAPYRFGGTSVKGLDCSAFVKKTYQFFNIDLPRTAFQQSLVGLRVKRSELVAGDLLFFNTRRRLGHVGIYIGNNQFVHASSYKRRVRVDNLNIPYFNKHFVRAVRLKGNVEGSEASRRPAHGG
ncbi:MAG: NlpC/P60 family protein [Deltaproteobacteria bacterium]|nr:NlpC/P60 family protein [Deltaproteobacteria bacterium]